MPQTTSELNRIAHQIHQINPVVTCHIQIPREGERRRGLSLTNAKIIKPLKKKEHGVHVSVRDKR